jgi:PhnB protein
MFRLARNTLSGSYLDIGDSVIVLADEHLEMDIRGPKGVGSTPVSLHVYVEDADIIEGDAPRR